MCTIRRTCAAFGSSSRPRLPAFSWTRSGRCWTCGKQGRSPCDYVRRRIDEKLVWTRERLQELRALEQELVRLKAEAERSVPASADSCDIVEGAR